MIKDLISAPRRVRARYPSGPHTCYTLTVIKDDGPDWGSWRRVTISHTSGMAEIQREKVVIPEPLPWPWPKTGLRMSVCNWIVILIPIPPRKVGVVAERTLKLNVLFVGRR